MSVKITIEKDDKKVEIDSKVFVEKALVAINKKIDIPFLSEEQEQAILNKSADFAEDALLDVLDNLISDVSE